MPKLLTYAIGYLRRPSLWRDLLRQPWRLVMLRHPREATREKATKWAEQRAMSTTDALIELGAGDSHTKMATRTHAEDFAEAADAAAKLSVRLGGSANVDLLYALVRSRAPCAVVETGVAAGWSSLAILLALEGYDDAHLISVDRPDMRLADNSAVGVVVPRRLRHKWTLLSGVDKDKLKVALESVTSGLKIVHYDSDKSYLGRAWAYKVIMDKLPVGGILVSDDIADNTAFKEFCETMEINPVIVRYGDSGLCGVAVKSRG